MDRFYWPTAFALMGILIGSKGGSLTEILPLSLAGGAVGCLISFMLIRLGPKNKAKFGLNVLAGALWAILVFGVGFPNLRRTHEPINVSDVAYLAALSMAPLIAFLIIGAISKTSSRS